MSTEYSTGRTSVRDDKDWRKITDAAERRRAQNRIAQRNYRRNVKLRQQQLDQINGTLASCSQDDSTNSQTLRLHSTALDASSSNTSSESSHQSIMTVPQSSTLFNTSWSDMMGTPFHSELAIDTEDLEALSLIPSTQDINPATQDGREVDCLARWRDSEHDPSSTNSSMTRPARSSESSPLNALQKAIVRGQNSVAKLLIENGANVHVVDENGNNILHLAVQSGSSALVLFALRNGIDVNDTNMLGHTALHVAIEREDLEIIKLLLGAGADIEVKS